MSKGLRHIIWTWRLRGPAAFVQYAPHVAAFTSVTCLCGYGIISTRKRLDKIVATGALERERSGRPEYLYVKDPAYEERMKRHLEDEDAWSFGPIIGRWVSRVRRAVWRRLLNISRNGELSDRIKALHHLAALKHLKVDDWDWVWLSQRLDARAMVLLARHGGSCAKHLAIGTPALPDPTRNLSLLSTLSNLALNYPQPCSCLKNFVHEQSDAHQEVQRLMEQETSGSSGNKQKDENVEFLNSLEVLLHHIDMSLRSKQNESESVEEVFAKKGGLAFIQKAALSPERTLRVHAARLMLRLSHYPDLLPLFHRAGLISILATWIDELEYKDAELSCMAAGVLASLDCTANKEEKVNEKYDPSVFLLHPTYRPKTLPKIDVVFIHGLLGEPFVTWRQRDDIDTGNLLKNGYSDDSENDENEKFEVVLRDVPEAAIRNPNNTLLVYSNDTRICHDEQKQLVTKTRCWPKDWLPFDCSNIRVLGVSYDTMMTEWSSGCGDVNSIEDRALILGKSLENAGVGSRPIVWVAHSMGGLLVKHILVHSLESKNDEGKKIAENTKGVIFFSTPHHGSRVAHALIWPSKEVQELRKDSKILGRLHKRWLAGKWPSICIGESKSTQLLSYPSLSLHLVPPDSADDNSGPLYTLPLDHLDICKPATRHSFIYRIVVEMIQHSKDEKCGIKDCVECTKNVVEDGKYKNAWKLWNDIVNKIGNLTSIFYSTAETIAKKFDNLDDFNKNLHEEMKEDENSSISKEYKDHSKDIKVDGWWLNIMHF